MNGAHKTGIIVVLGFFIVCETFFLYSADRRYQETHKKLETARVHSAHVEKLNKEIGVALNKAEENLNQCRDKTTTKEETYKDCCIQCMQQIINATREPRRKLK